MHMAHVLKALLLLASLSANPVAAVEESDLCWEKICVGMTLSETKARLQEMGYSYDSRWFARMRERLSFWGGVFEFEGYAEHVSARADGADVEVFVVRFPSGRLRVYNLTATTKIRSDNSSSLAEKIDALEQRFGPADRVSWDENRTWNGFWESRGRGIGNWLAVDLIPDVPVTSNSDMDRSNSDHSALSNSVLAIRTTIHSLHVGRQAETAWAGEHADWIADQVNNCRVWNNFPRDGDTITWNGNCVGGKADGFGTLKWSSHSHVYETIEGNFRGGRIDGSALVKLSEERWFEGEFRDNLPNGPGTLYENGQTYTGNWKDGCLVQNSHSMTFYTHRDLCEPF